MTLRLWLSLSTLALTIATPPARAQSENRIYNLLFAERTRLEKIENDATAPADQIAAAKAERERLATVMYDPSKYRLQIQLAEIASDAGQPPALKISNWRAGSDFFYPASAIKLCGAVAALERLNELQRTKEPAFTENTPLAFYSLEKGQAPYEKDPSNVDGGKVTLAMLIREIGLVSDNEAYNRLYDFCGQQWLNERMWRAGLPSTRLSQRLSADVQKAKQKTTPAVEIRYPDHTTILGAQYSPLNLEPTDIKGMYVGKGFLDGKEHVRGGFSFYDKNVMNLTDLQNCLVRIVRPDIKLAAGEPFDLTDAQRTLLMDALSQYPGDSKNPVFPRDKYPDEYCKYFLPGLARVVPKDHLKVYDKVGQAYGFVIDNAYVVDTSTKRAFFLSATVWADSDGILNDDKYDYDTLSVPLMADIAEIIARDVWAVPVAK
jgi:hypothetical protein